MNTKANDARAKDAKPRNNQHNKSLNENIRTLRRRQPFQAFVILKRHVDDQSKVRFTRPNELLVQEPQLTGHRMVKRTDVFGKTT